LEKLWRENKYKEKRHRKEGNKGMKQSMKSVRKKNMRRKEGMKDESNEESRSKDTDTRNAHANCVSWFNEICFKRLFGLQFPTHAHPILQAYVSACCFWK
jgi:hypothetical protein